MKDESRKIFSLLVVYRRLVTTPERTQCRMGREYRGEKSKIQNPK
jgi:hypothetical protein